MVTLYGGGTAPKTEILVNGTWTDYSSRVRADSAISITRGRANQQGTVTAQTCNLALNNRDGLFSNRNPNSALFGLLPRNTNLRVSAGTGDIYLKAMYTEPNALRNIQTADKAVLDVTGDIDIRCEIWPHSWRPTASMMIMSKYTITGNQRSWVLYLGTDGKLVLRWSTDGTSGGVSNTFATAPVPAGSGRLAIRCTLKVNNGAGGNDTQFFTAPDINSTYTQLGSTITQSGTTSLFNSSAPLIVAGGASDSQQLLSGAMAYGGRFYKAELRNGIFGTLVANMDSTAQALGATTWSDGLGTPNTWTIVGTGVRVTSDRVRFVGEMSALPQTMDVTGKDIYVPVTASGLLRRLTQGNSPKLAPMNRNFGQYAGTAGYWPLDDATGSTQAAAGVPACNPSSVVNVSFGSSNTGIPGTTGTAQFVDATSKIYGSAPALSSTGNISFVVYIKVPSLPASSKVFCVFSTSGLARLVTIALSATTWDLTFLDKDGATLANIGTPYGTTISPAGQWIGINVALTQSGGNVTYSARWDTVSTYGGGIGPTSLGAGSCGVPTGYTLTAANDTVFQTASFAQVLMTTSVFDITNPASRGASNAWLNETAIARMARLATAAGIPLEPTGIAADSAAMGYQPVDSIVNLIFDCWNTDQGIGGECRDALALSYRTRADLENRTDVTLDWASSQLAATPVSVEDDSNFFNDVTATRPSGSSAQFQVLDGQTSIYPPPQGVGDYDTAITPNVALDSQLISAAGWYALASSWDEPRFPNVVIGMHRSQILASSSLYTACLQMDLGDTMALTTLPIVLAPGTIYELVQGYTETLNKFLWTITANCTPASPYQAVGRLNSDYAIPRLDFSLHTLGGTMTTSSTSVTLVTPAMSAVAVDSTNFPAEFPFDLRIAGEVMTCTAISGTTSPQTMTLTRNINGITPKTHASGELVRLAHPFYLGR